MESGEKSIVPHLDIQTLVVAPKLRREIAVGDADSFKRIATQTTGIQAVLWNEGSITLMTGDPSTTITFMPELVPDTAMFFMREEKRMGGNPFKEGDGVRVWEGDYSPVRFTKSGLLKFLKDHSFKSSIDIVGKIKEMKINERKTTTESMINLENDDNFRRVEEQELTTNIPAKFSMEMPLVQTPEKIITVNLDFEAQVVREKDSWRGDEKGKPLIQLRCVNAREQLHRLMLEYTKLVPETIPKYYGRLAILTSN